MGIPLSYQLLTIFYFLEIAWSAMLVIEHRLQKRKVESGRASNFTPSPTQLYSEGNAMLEASRESNGRAQAPGRVHLACTSGLNGSRNHTHTNARMYILAPTGLTSSLKKMTSIKTSHCLKPVLIIQQQSL